MSVCTQAAQHAVADALGLAEDLEETRAATEHRATCDDCSAFGLLAEDAAQALTLPEAELPSGDWEALSARIQADQARGQLRIVLSCTFCHDALERPSAVYCATCLAPHHGDCFEQHGRCSAPGCDETQAVQATPLGRAPRKARRWPAWIGVSLLALGGVAALNGEGIMNRIVPPSADRRLAGRDPVPAPIPAPSAIPAPAATPAPGSAPPRFLSDGTVAFRAQDANLRDLCDLLSDLNPGCRVLVHPEVTAETVTLTVERRSWRDAVTAVADAASAAIDVRDNGVLILIPPAAFSRNYEDVDLRVVIRDLASAAGVNVIVAPEVQGRVTQTFSGIYPREALVAFVQAAGPYLVVEESDDLLRVVSRASIPVQLETAVLPIYAPAPATELRRGAEELFERIKTEPRSFVDYDQRSHSLVILAAKATIKALAKYVEEAQATSPVPLTSSVVRDGQGTVSVEFRDVDLREAVALLAGAVNESISVDAGVGAERVSLRLSRVTWRAALEEIALTARCSVEDRQDSFVLTQPSFVSVHAEEDDVRLVVQRIAAQANVSVVMHPEFTGQVTMDLNGIHLVRALHAIVKTVGEFVLLEEVPGVFRIVPESAVETQVRTTVFALKRPAEESVVRVLRKSFERLDQPKEASLNVTQGATQVIFTGTSEAYAVIRAVLRGLDLLAEDR